MADQRMSEAAVVQAFMEAVYGEDFAVAAADQVENVPNVMDTADFSAAGVMSRDSGFVVRFEDGTSFNVTVQQTR